MTTIAVRHLKTIKDKSIGLLGVAKAHPVYFTTRWGIHTFGIQFPIDVMILDKNFSVVKIAKQVQPNTIVLWNPKHYHVIELPAGEIEKQNIMLTQIITLRYRDD